MNRLRTLPWMGPRRNGLLLGLLVSWTIHAQPISVRALPNPAPIPAGENVLLFPDGDSAFLPFFRKMDALVFEGKEEINLVHVGGSHVQAGLLTDAIRYHLQSLAPGLAGERGFFFPFTLARTNNPPSYKVWTNQLDSWNGQRCSVPVMRDLGGLRVFELGPEIVRFR